MNKKRKRVYINKEEELHVLPIVCEYGGQRVAGFDEDRRGERQRLVEQAAGTAHEEEEEGGQVQIVWS